MNHCEFKASLDVYSEYRTARAAETRHSVLETETRVSVSEREKGGGRRAGRRAGRQTDRNIGENLRQMGLFNVPCLFLHRKEIVDVANILGKWNRDFTFL